MSPLKFSIITALLASTLTAGCFYYFHQKKAGEVYYLRYRNSQLLFQAYQSSRTGTATPTVAPTAVMPLATGVISAQEQKPKDNYRNAGQSTPLAALHTFAWACDRGDTETVVKMICFEATARIKAEAYLAALPENARAKWKSVDNMAADHLALEGMASPFPNADILDAAVIEQISAERALFRLPGTRKDRTALQRSGDNWQVVITDAMIDGFAKNADYLATAK